MNAKILTRQLLSVFLVLCIIMGMVPTMAMAANEEVPRNPATKALQDAIDNLPAEGGIVHVPEGTTTLSHTLVIPAGKQITLSGVVDNNGDRGTVLLS